MKYGVIGNYWENREEEGNQVFLFMRRGTKRGSKGGINEPILAIGILQRDA